MQTRSSGSNSHSVDRVPSRGAKAFQAVFNQRFANESTEPNANIRDRKRLKCQIYLTFPKKQVCS
jgi:hypothetical protein